MVYKRGLYVIRILILKKIDNNDKERKKRIKEKIVLNVWVKKIFEKFIYIYCL